MLSGFTLISSYLSFIRVHVAQSDFYFCRHVTWVGNRKSIPIPELDTCCQIKILILLNDSYVLFFQSYVRTCYDLSICQDLAR